MPDVKTKPGGSTGKSSRASISRIRQLSSKPLSRRRAVGRRFTQLLLARDCRRVRLIGWMKILIVEDEVILRDGLVDLLKAAGHTVAIVGDGLDATKRALDPELDLVLLDVL